MTPRGKLSIFWIGALAAVIVACVLRGFALAASAAASLTTNSLLDPPVSDGERIPVAIAMRVINVSDIDEVAQRFRMVGYLLAQWKDPRLVFTPRGSWEKFRVYAPDQVWSPHFDFVNGVVPHEARDISIRAYPDGTVKYSERSSAELSNTFRLRPFPFDRQTLEILIHPTVAENPSVELTELGGAHAISAEPRVFTSLAQWTITSLGSATERIPGIADETIPEIDFTITIVRRYNFYIWKVFLPLVLMVVLSWTVFWIDPSELSSQVQISVTTILTVIAFAFAIQANLPKVPYLTFIDVFFLNCYLFVFITAIGITAMHVSGRSGRSVYSRRLSGLGRIALPIAFFTVNLLIVISYFG